MTEKKCIHKINMKGHGDPWCVLFRKAADCDLCFGVATGTFHEPFHVVGDGYTVIQSQAESRSHRVGQKPRPVKIVGDTLRDAVPPRADAPVFTKVDAVMLRDRAEKMARISAIYGGTKQLQRIKSLAVGLQIEAATLNHKQTLVNLIGRPGVSLLRDEFVINQKEWISPFTEGELVTYNDQLARVIKITGPVIKIRLQHRDYPKHLDVMDWDIKKRSIIKWVVECWRKLWHKA